MAAEPLTFEEAARIFKEEMDIVEESEKSFKEERAPFGDYKPGKCITILTFGNAYGKGFDRILHYLKKLAVENRKSHDIIYVQILSIDPEFRSHPPLYVESRIIKSFKSIGAYLISIKHRSLREELPEPNYINESEPDHISSQKLLTYVGNFDTTLYINSIGKIVNVENKFEHGITIAGTVCFIADELPSQYTNRDIEFTKQIHKDKSFAYADQCIPSEDHPFRHLLPYLQRVLASGGTVIVDNDAWHEMNIPDKGVQYLSNLYMQYYCEVLYFLRQMHNPNILFLHAEPKSIVEFDLKPLDAEFLPKGTLRFYPPVRFNNSPAGGSRRTRRKTRKLKRRRSMRR